MEIIDSHVHLYPPEINCNPAGWAAAHGEGHWATLCTRVRGDGRAVQGFPNVDELLRAMDDAGVARAVLQGWYWERAESCALQNRFYAECIRAHPDRLSACASVFPGEGGWDDVERVRGEVWRAVDEGFVGLGEMSPHSQGVAANNAALLEAFACADEAGLAVCLHVTESAGDAGARNYPGKVFTPLGEFLGWAQIYTRARFVLAHWGARLPLDVRWGDEALFLKNVFYDTAASPLIYGAEASAGIWREMADAAGADRILFGSDYPLVLFPKRQGNEKKAMPEMASLVEEARESGLRGEELAAVLGGNSRRVFL